jgi:probable phosphoglycerate mutase
METMIYLVRHGETEWNREGRLQGQLNSPLTAEGIAQTESFSTQIQELNPHIVYSSDQERAVVTAQILTANLEREIIYDRNLSEMNFGIFQGHNWDYIENNMQDIYDQYRADDPDYVIPEGESHNQFHSRVTETLQRIADDNPGRKILIISHGGSINKMLCYARGMKPSGNRYFKTENLALNVLKYKDGEFTLQTPVELIDFTKALVR